MSFRRAAKVDNNQKEIVTALRRAGAQVFHVHQVKNLFDLIVMYQGAIYCVEVKSNTKSKLTKGEEETKNKVESVGCNYHIIYSVEDALKLIGI